MLSMLFGKARSPQLKLTWGGTLLSAALSLAAADIAEAQGDDEELELDEELDDPRTHRSKARRNVSDETDEDSTSSTKPAPKFKVETGAPRPPAQTTGIAPPPPPPPGTPPPPPTLKVGGAFIVAYFHPYGIKEDSKKLGLPVRKPSMEVFRAALFLDSKIDRFGVHIEFRARDKRLRNFSEGTAWLEETYGSVDLVKADNPFGPLTLKVGKMYRQFGRYWDDSFYGNIHLRDGLKLDTNYGASLEGEIGRGKLFGAKYYAQYFVIDGGTNTAGENRDTFTSPAPESGYPSASYGSSRARRRNEITARVEPGFMFDAKKMAFLKFGGSISNFTADFGPTIDQQDVKRFGGDITANFLWFGAWAEYTLQKGRSLSEFPFPSATVKDPMTGASVFRPGQSSDDIQYLHAGGRVMWKGIMLRYNYSSGEYRNVKGPLTAPQLAALGDNAPTLTVKEHMHVPGLMITATQQLFLMIETPVHKQHRTKWGSAKGQEAQDFIIDKQVVITLHARI